jgi:uncharacterized cupin superfamily protein
LCDEQEAAGVCGAQEVISDSVLMIAAQAVDLKPEPISPGWILSGTPESRSKEIARSLDRMSCAMVWDCTAGVFNWDYNKDEGLVVLAGEAFIVCGDSPERRIGPGDFVFFPAGTSAKWRVPKYIKKVAFLRQTMPRLVGFGVLIWNFLRRLIRVAEACYT